MEKLMDQYLEQSPPPHPGIFVQKEILEQYGFTQAKVARDLKVSPGRINRLVHLKAKLSKDLAARFSQYTSISLRKWLTLNTNFILWKWEQNPENLKRLEKIQPPE